MDDPVTKWDGTERREPERNERWHIGKEIPLAVLVVLLIQTGGGIWWLAQLGGKLDFAVATIQEFKAERYTRDDARRDFELARQRDGDAERRIADIERKHNDIEAMIRQHYTTRRQP